MTNFASLVHIVTFRIYNCIMQINCKQKTFLLYFYFHLQFTYTTEYLHKFQNKKIFHFHFHLLKLKILAKKCWLCNLFCGIYSGLVKCIHIENKKNCLQIEHDICIMESINKHISRVWKWWLSRNVSLHIFIHNEGKNYDYKWTLLVFVCEYE